MTGNVNRAALPSTWVTSCEPDSHRRTTDSIPAVSRFAVAFLTTVIFIVVSYVALADLMRQRNERRFVSCACDMSACSCRQASCAMPPRIPRHRQG